MTTYNAECYGAWSVPEPQNDKQVETFAALRHRLPANFIGNTTYRTLTSSEVEEIRNNQGCILKAKETFTTHIRVTSTTPTGNKNTVVIGLSENQAQQFIIDIEEYIENQTKHLKEKN